MVSLWNRFSTDACGRFSSHVAKFYLIVLQQLTRIFIDISVRERKGSCFFLVSDILLFHDYETSSLFINPYLR